MNFKEKITELVSLSQGLCILYVEDESNVRENTYMLLSNIFSSIDIAKNGMEGLDLYKIKKYDIIMSDILMPICNGITMLETIKKLHPSQKVIITSACDETKYHGQLEAMDISDFITKPIEIEPLVDVLYTLVKEINTTK